MEEEHIDLIKKIGFSDKEAKVYLALVELGQADVTDIAKHSGLKRSIIYVVLDDLVERGYVVLDLKEKVNRYTAIDPQKVFYNVKSVFNDFEQALPSLQAVYNKKAKKPKISYFEGKKGVMSVYRQIDQAGDALVITSYARMAKYMKNEVKRFFRSFKNRSIPFQAKNLIPNTPEDIRLGKILQKYGQETRVIPDKQNLFMDFVLFDGKLAITSLSDQLFVVVIESEPLFKSMKIVFEMAWRQGKRLDEVK